MTKGSQISNRDLERLSAFLDGALSAKEASRLEARLREDPILKQALLDLKATTQMVASLSEIPLPRSFTLTPEMAGIKERPRIYPVLRLATALAAFAFVALVGVDAITSFAIRGAMAPASEEQIAMEAPAPAAEILRTGEAPEEGLAVEEALLADEQAAPSEVAEYAAEAENEIDRTAPSGVLGMTEESEPEAPEGEKTVLPKVSQTLTPAASDLAAGEQVVDDPAVEPTPTLEIQPTPLPTPTAVPLRRTFQLDPRSILRVAEFGLGGLALLLAGITIWMARRNG